jgi:plastocyanin
MRLNVRRLCASVAAALLLGCSTDSTSSEQVLTSVEVHPRDALLMAGAVWPDMHYRALDREGHRIAATGVWSSSDASIVKVDPASGEMTAVSRGFANVTNTVTYKGLTVSGSLFVLVDYPIDLTSIGAVPSLVFGPEVQSVTRRNGKATVWWNFSRLAHTVTWDSQPPGARVANIVLSKDTSVPRDFTVAGTYRYHCAIHGGMKGALIVL